MILSLADCSSDRVVESSVGNGRQCDIACVGVTVQIDTHVARLGSPEVYTSLEIVAEYTNLSSLTF